MSQKMSQKQRGGEKKIETLENFHKNKSKAASAYAAEPGHIPGSGEALAKFSRNYA